MSSPVFFVCLFCFKQRLLFKLLVMYSKYREEKGECCKLIQLNILVKWFDLGGGVIALKSQ